MKKLKGNSPEHICYYIGLTLLTLSIILTFLKTKGVFNINQILPPCIFYTVTHLPCPGCGMTRAVNAFFSMDFFSSLFFNPVALYLVLFFAVYMISHTLELLFPRIRGLKLRIGYVYFGIILLLGQWVIKILIIFLF